jgi:transcriptional regulator with XRE-family HTH domain
MPKSKFEEFLQDYEHRRVFQQESLAFEATEMICTLLKHEGIPKAELAKRIGKSKAYVTQVLSGARNMTLHTFADFAFALGHKVDINPIPLNMAAQETIVFKTHITARSLFRAKRPAWEVPAAWDTPVGQGACSVLPTPGEQMSETAHAA